MSASDGGGSFILPPLTTMIPKVVSTISSMFPQPADGSKPGINLNYNEIPSYIQTNHIHGHYRAHLSIWQCFISMFQYHNETLQIWSHLVPAIILWYYALFKSSTSTHKVQIIPSCVRLYCIGFATVFTASWFAHTFNPINESWYLLCWRIDWGAISFAIWGTTWAIAELGFHKLPLRANIWKSIFTTSCLLFFYKSTKKEFHLEASVMERASISLIMAATIIGFCVDVARTLPTFDLQQVKAAIRLPMILVVVGMTIFAAEFPESQFVDVNFDMSRGHHLIHHLWSTIFALLLRHNLIKWHKDQQ